MTSNIWVSDVKLWSFPAQMWSNTAQREDVFNEQEMEKPSERCPTFKQFAESSERTYAELFRSWPKIRIRTSPLGRRTAKFEIWNSDVWRHLRTCFAHMRSQVDAIDGMHFKRTVSWLIIDFTFSNIKIMCKYKTGLNCSTNSMA